ncbi:MAG TPA: hypothetical protein DEB40_00160, partial [Elusimicrobia bacterium]|nr:hypothetical protein [Elusimicrobiota bacterium]
MATLAPGTERIQSSHKPFKPAFPLWLRHGLRTFLHLAFDASAVSSSYALAYLWRFRSERWVSAFPIPGLTPDWDLYRNMLYVAVPLWLMIFWYSSRLYSNPWISGADRFLKIVKGCLLATVATMATTYIYSRLEYSRMMLILVLPISVILVSLSQAVVLWVDDWVSRHENARPVLLIGGGAVLPQITGSKRLRSRSDDLDFIADDRGLEVAYPIFGMRPAKDIGMEGFHFAYVNEILVAVFNSEIKGYRIPDEAYSGALAKKTEHGTI